MVVIPGSIPGTILKFKSQVQDYKTTFIMEQTIKNLHFRWTISKGRETYGYNICTLLVDGIVKGKCNGGGYDMQGTSLGKWLQADYTNRIEKLFSKEIEKAKEQKPLKLNNYIRVIPEKFHGVTIIRNVKTNRISVYVDGAAGFDSMRRIAESIGINLKWNAESDRYKNHSFYTAIINNNS